MPPLRRVACPSHHARAIILAGDQQIAKLVALWPVEIADVSAAGRRHLIGRLEQVLKAERRRGRAGHWTYDLARHAALARLLREERAALAALKEGRATAPR